MTIKQVLIERDGMRPEEADELIATARMELMERIAVDPIGAYEICSDYFGLEPDYLEELL